MLITSEQDIKDSIVHDLWMMEVLENVASLNLADWAVGAGFVRNKIWDVSHGYQKRTPLNDIDVLYFDPLNLGESREKELERELALLDPTPQWSVKNQARMHLKKGLPPHKNTLEAISYWVEVPTAVAVTLDAENNVALLAPYGIEHFLTLEVFPTPFFSKPERYPTYLERVQQKNWQNTWPKLKIRL